MRSHASSCPLQSFQNEQAMARGLFRQNRLSSAVTLHLRWRTVTTQPAQLWRTMLRDGMTHDRLIKAGRKQDILHSMQE